MKCTEKYKYKTHLSKDRLFINGHSFTVNNISDANHLLDVKSTCERCDDDKILFLGSLSPFSNLYSAKFNIENIEYNCSEQFIQSQKASIFNDDVTQARILNESNLYKIKKLGSKVRNFNPETWKKMSVQVTYCANIVKFLQNNILKTLF